MRTDETADQSTPRRDSVALPGVPVPGFVQLYATDAPAFAVGPVTAEPVVIGRGEDCDLVLDDRRASRRHAEVRYADGRWHVTDLGSHNGTFVEAARIDGTLVTADDVVLAVGNTLFLLLADVRPLRSGISEHGGVVRGPRFASLWPAVARYATSSSTLHVIGETGSGKELVGRHFHACRAPDGPFVAINCAAVPPLLAERLFFGARKGAYSGADADSDGYLLAADRGVLFLDEIGELPLDVQAKLLRVIETRELLPLGATKPRSLELSICSATHVDLRDAVARGRFREDLYFRIASPSVEVPPLRARREEIPWLIDVALRGGSVRAHASFVEAALVRPWPGNVRELLTTVASAATQVVPPETHLKMAQLAPQAGAWLAPARPDVPERVATGEPGDPPDPETAAICEALRKQNGNVTRAARALDVHRNQLRRWLKRNNVDPRSFKSGLLGVDGSE